MGRARYIAGFFAIAVGLYFSLTWFFFGSVHPCGILEVRQRPYVINMHFELQKSEQDDLDLKWSGPRNEKYYTQMEEIVVYNATSKNTTLRTIHERAWSRTPAQCLKRAIMWDPDPFKGV